MSMQEDLNTLKLKVLQHYWGHQQFRLSQSEIIDHVISKKDTLVLLPTGGGKSLCYQIPALLLEGTCLVISPLLALMKDQVLQLKSQNIEAEYLSSDLDEFQSETIYARCKEGITKILYVSPERLSNSVFLNNIADIQISFLAVDEAHCISEWGQDFRPSYQNILQFRNNMPDVSCIALTATATTKVLKEISSKLGLKKPSIFKESYNRENIKIHLDEVNDKYSRILDLIKLNPSSGIIYTRTRKDAEELCSFLKRNNCNNVDYYHAGLPPQERNRKQNTWLNNPNQILISTNAFGMGINKNNVRFVLHLSPPQSIENYYQEIGRAGRDGNNSLAYLLWNEQELQEYDLILKNQIPNKSEFTKVITYLYSLYQIAEYELNEHIFQFNIFNLKKVSRVSESKIKNILNFLHHQEIVFLNTYKSLSSLELKLQAEEIELISKKDSYFIELLLRSLPGISTHRVLFNEKKLASKMGVDVLVVKERIKEMNDKGHLEYIDGALSSIKFLKHRNDRDINGQYWNLFEQIQRNKIQKWEEMKYFIENRSYCKMRMILSYFGEKETSNCGKCSFCISKNTVNVDIITEQIIEILQKRPSTVDEIAIQLNQYKREKILENIILLLDAEKVKMLDFRTYCLV